MPLVPSGQPFQPFQDIEAVYDALYRYCYYRLRHAQHAEDVTQEAFLRALAALPGLPPPHTETQALRYLYTVARNLCVDEYRRAPRAPLPLPEEESAQPAVPGFEAVSTETLALRAALARLPEQQRELLLLRYANDLPAAAIAGLLGISRFAVYRQCQQALKSLRTLLEEE